MKNLTPSLSAPTRHSTANKKWIGVKSVILVLFFALSSTITFGQFSAPNFTPPPEKKAPKPSLEVQVNQHQAPMSLIKKEISLVQIKEIRLGEMTQSERASQPNKKQFRIGAVRQLPNSAQKIADYSRLEINEGQLYLLRISSPQATSLRLHFSDLSLPEGAVVFAYSRANQQNFAGPYTAKTGKSEFWTPSLSGEEIVVELFLPNKIKLDAIPLRIDSVSHIFRNPRSLINPDKSTTEAAGDCEQEVPAEWQSKATSVGLIAFVKTDGEYACSGTLLSDIKKTRTPFFLTANHCIGNDREAGSSEVYWLFNSGAEPLYAPTRGSRILVTDKGDDYTLLELYEKPSGVTYSGWNPATPTPGSTVTTIHHPQAEHKRLSTGQIVDEACSAEVAPEFCRSFIKVRWSAGITEPGSSGAGLFSGPANNSVLVGLLSGGESSCENPTGIDYFPRLNSMFGAIGYYLTNGELCRYGLTQKEFVYSQNGGSGEFSVVPKIGAVGCPWQAFSNADWVTITSPTSGVDDGKITFQVAANSTGKPRIGAIKTSGRNVMIYQPETSAVAACSATPITIGQTVTGDLATATCSSMIDPEVQALRYSFNATVGQVLTINSLQYAWNSTVRIFAPDGTIYTMGSSYIPVLAPMTGTYMIEYSRFPLAFPAPFSFTLSSSCRMSFSPRRFEVDAYSNLIGSDLLFPKVKAEFLGGQCDGFYATGDEPVLDDVHAPYTTTDQTLNVFPGENIANQQRYKVIKALGQPIIIKQYGMCSGAMFPTFTPSTINIQGQSSQQKVDVKMVGNNICSWTAQAYEVYEGGNESPVGDFSDSFRLLGSRAYNGGMRGTGTAPILYNVPVNANFTPRNYVLKYGDQTVHSVAQQPFGNTCSRAAAQLGTTINGSLSVNDCAWLDADSRVDFYEIDGVAGELYALEFSSPLAEKMILSFRDNNQLGYGFDSISAGDSFPRIPRENLGQFPSTGKYTLRVSGKQGAYQIKLISVGPAGCVYNIDRSGEALLPASENTNTVNLTCNRGDCDWAISSSAPWITFPNAKNGKGSAAINFTLSPNSGAPRQAIITIGGRSFTINQDAPCSFLNFPYLQTSKIYIGQKEATYTIPFYSGSTCPAPTVANSNNWATFTVSTNQLQLLAQTNSGAVRRGFISVGGQNYEVIQGGNNVAVVTSGDYKPVLAPGSLASLFHNEMSEGIAAGTFPLPISLANAEVYITDSSGRGEHAQLLFVSPGQINFLIPDWVKAGTGKVEVFHFTGYNTAPFATGQINIETVAPNVFTASSDGKGVASANIQRIRPGQPDVYENTAQVGIDEQGKPIFIARLISLGEDSEQTFLVLYATGLRKRNQNLAVTAKIGGVEVPVQYAGPQGFFVGLDQVNILLPKTLRGKGLVNITVSIEGKTTNPVQINIAP